MTLITPEQAERVSGAIRAVEAETDAELVTVLATQADDYLYIPTLWAALLAMLTPAILFFSPFWLDPMEVFLGQTVVFLVFALVGRIPAVTQRLIPRRVRTYRAQNLARRQFLEQNLHHTANGQGVLIFVSEMEHYVEVLADTGISSVVDDATWQIIVDEFVHHVQTGDTERGFLSAIDAIGTVLRRVAPATRQKDELPNHLVLLD